MLDKLLPFLIAAALGLIIGIERERRHFKHQAMGVRTFILLGLLGALAGVVEDTLVRGAITLFAAAAIVVSYMRTSTTTGGDKVDMGLTTEIAAGATFLLGFLTHRDPLLSAMLGLLVLIVLLSRTPLHRFSREQLKPNEIQAAVILFVLVIGILPLLPDQAIDPWNLFSPKRFVTIVALVAGIEFVSYVAIRIWGGSVGTPISGFFAGFISSTAAFLTLPGLVKKNKSFLYPAASAAMFAAVSTFLFLLFIVAFLSVDIFWKVLPALLSSIVIGACSGFMVARRAKSHASSFSELKNPLSLLSALRLALFLTLVFIVISAIQKLVGPAGTQIASFVSGLGELHGVSISATLLYVDGSIDRDVARNSILLAALASLLSKLVITWILIRDRFAVIVSTVVVAMAVSLGLFWWLF